MLSKIIGWLNKKSSNESLLGEHKITYGTANNKIQPSSSHTIDVSSDTNGMFDYLPNEVIIDNIAPFFDLNSLVNFARTNKELYNLVLEGTKNIKFSYQSPSNNEVQFLSYADISALRLFNKYKNQTSTLVKQENQCIHPIVLLGASTSAIVGVVLIAIGASDIKSNKNDDDENTYEDNKRSFSDDVLIYVGVGFLSPALFLSCNALRYIPSLISHCLLKDKLDKFILSHDRLTLFSGSSKDKKGGKIEEAAHEIKPSL